MFRLPGPDEIFALFQAFLYSEAASVQIYTFIIGQALLQLGWVLKMHVTTTQRCSWLIG